MTTESATPSRRRPGPPKRSRLPLLLVIGAVAVTALVTFLVTRDDDDSGQPEAVAVKSGVPTILSEADLRAYGRAQPTPVYWIGPQPNRRYELTRTTSGRYFIRYLTPKADVGDKQSRFITVGTYPGTNAYGALQTVSRRSGSVRIDTKSGALVVYSKTRPESVYFAFPNTNFQVEVYDPKATRARAAVLEGKAERLR